LYRVYGVIALNMLKAVWHYRYFVLSSVKNDVKARFSRSRLGAFWIVLHPLAMVLIYALILSSLIKAKLPDTDTIYAYPIYLTSGILAWTIFVESITRSLNLFLEQGSLIKKVAFPKSVLPLITAGTVFVNSLVLLAAIFVVFAFLGHFPGIQALWLPVLFIITLMFGMSLGLIFGLLNVFIRDIAQMVHVLLQFGFWLTPIVYTISIIPEAHQHWFAYNPMAHITGAFQDVLLYNHMVKFHHLIFIVILSIALLALGLFMFKKAGAEMVDHL
jgi:lipopolysaccharide transport system permease protein